MTQPQFSGDALANATREEMMSALFATTVIQFSNMAMTLMGKMPHPDGQMAQDLQAAKMFIDQLEMIEVKTKGNLDKNEERLLKQQLMMLRMVFVEAVEAQSSTAAPEPAPAPEAQSSAAPTASAPEAAAAPASEAASKEDDSKKKFTKKY
jgi:hypothetical protein